MIYIIFISYYCAYIQGVCANVRISCPKIFFFLSKSKQIYASYQSINDIVTVTAFSHAFL